MTTIASRVNQGKMDELAIDGLIEENAYLHTLVSGEDKTAEERAEAVISRNCEEFCRLTRQDLKKELAGEVAVELDELVDRLDSFLEKRIMAEFEELKDDIKCVRATNMALIRENMLLRDEVSCLSIENLKLSLGQVPVKDPDDDEPIDEPVE